MHMADALLSPAVGATFWAGALGSIGWCARKLREDIDEKMVPLMGVLGAFTFAAQMINFTIPGTGSSGHLGGGMILAVILGPHAAFIVMASVLTVQSFFFADGGLLALGCNIWNLVVYPCFIAYPLIYKPLVRSGATPRRILTASVMSGVAGLQLGAFSVVLQTLLSGRSELPFSTFVIFMQPIHLVIGLVEGFVTAGVINFVRAYRPDVLNGAATAGPPASGTSGRKVIASLLLAALLTGGVLSWFASSNPDGLEWSIEKVLGRPGLPEQKDGIGAGIKRAQGKTALLPDHKFKQSDGKGKNEGGEQAWPGPDAGTSASGIVGAGLVLVLVFGIGLGIRLASRKRG